MTTEILMPKHGLNMSEGLIAEWRVREGDQVEIGTVLFVFETDKATVEHEADVAGIVANILADAGSSVPVGETVCLIEVQENGRADGRAGGSTDAPSTITEDGRVDGCAGAPAAHGDCCEGDDAGGNMDAPSYTLATPWVKKLAKDKGISLAAICPTGNNGRITPYDVELAAKDPGADCAAANRGAVAGTGQAISDSSGQIAAAARSGEAAGMSLGGEIAMTGIKRITGLRMAQSFSEIPHIYFKVKVNMAETAALRKKLADEEGIRVTYSDFFLCAVARAISAFPIANASLLDGKIYANQDINIGFATATPKGLVVPIIAQAQRFTFPELSRLRKGIVEKALKGKLMPEEMEGGTFTITNLGSFDVDSFQPIINPPQAAILAVGSIREEVLVHDQSIKICPVAEICLAGDHRVMDGADCAAFLSEIKRRLENAETLV
jgi:pyruvate dehydrogenase E2 component (dihydrolipoamide acetyltransferase)